MRIPFLRPKAPTTGERPVSIDGGEPTTVRDARTRARQRLTGALVLLVLGVLLFPWLFESQPRPLAVDTPIVMLPRDGGAGASAVATPVPTSTSTPALAAGAAPVRALPTAPVASAAVAGASAAGAVTHSAGHSTARPVAGLAAAPAANSGANPTPATAPVVLLKTAPAVAPTPAAAAAASGSAATRYVVQAGAYGEASALREARQKVEKLGLKTYTQVIDNGSGKRTRVRVGPFDTRTEADAIAAKVKAAGVQANVLAL